jgi:hypothetical protein
MEVAVIVLNFLHIRGAEARIANVDCHSYHKQGLLNCYQTVQEDVVVSLVL